MIRHVFAFNLTSIDALPRMERWYRQYHAPETVRKLGPWLRRYESYRAVHRSDLADLGYYNYRWSEMWFDRFEPTDPPTGLTWYEGQGEDLGDVRTDDRYNADWGGRREGPHPPLQLFLPGVPELVIDNHRGMHTPAPTLRWIAVLRFPNDRAAGDRWITDEVLPTIANAAGVTHVLSSGALHVPEEKLRELSPGEPRQFPWHRWVEVRFTRYDPWLECLKATLAAPSGNKDRAGPIEPYVDLVSTVVLEKPDWTLAELSPFP